MHGPTDNDQTEHIIQRSAVKLKEFVSKLQAVRGQKSSSSCLLAPVGA